jgi:hypothetical protein
VSDVILLSAGGYLGAGMIFAIAFVFRLIARIDPTAAEGPLGFRLVLLPGAAALWPVLLRKVVRQRVPGEEGES